MPFSTPTSIITLHPSISTSSTASISHIKKVFATLRNKLPTSSSNGNTSSSPSIVKHNSTTVIKVVAKPKTSVYSSIKKQQDINKDLRQFYTQNTRKRQLSHEEERQLNEIRYKTVKQYQQIKKHHDWKEEHSVINNAENIYQTHHHVRRDTRSNSNYLRIMATTHNPTSAKPFIKKRSDVFIYGRQSNLRNAL